MSGRTVELRTTLAYAQGAYSVGIKLGSQQRLANLLLDTGSSSLVVLPHAYDPDADAAHGPTSLAQTVSYGQGSWAGPVLHSQVTLGDGQHERVIGATPLALVESAAQNFRNADGLFGLAYRGLDSAYDFQQYLSGRGTQPASTWPWPFDDDLQAFRTLARQQPRVSVTPCFTALEQEGVVANVFAMVIRRALVHVLRERATATQLLADPLNSGMLVLGGGEQCQSLYHGALQSIRIVHDLYYNARLIAVQVGAGPRIAAPALAEKDVARAGSNAIFDTGSSFVILQQQIYDAVIAAFREHDPALPALIERFQQAFRNEEGLPNSQIEHRAWPELHFVLESSSGGEVILRCDPEDYWPHNALKAGQSLFLLMSQLPNWPDQSILGLPLLAGRYCVFDRRIDGLGALKVAKARE
ncbi:MAG: pepsin-like aspartyl protease [Lysobacterales bacterium]